MEKFLKAKLASLVQRLADTEAELDALLLQSDEAVTSDLFSEVRYRRLINCLPSLFFELAPDGTTLSVNPAVTTLTGFRPEDLVGEDWWAVFCPREHSRRASELRWQLQSRDVAGHEMVLVGKNREPVVLELTTANWYGPGGELRRVVGMGIDVTARKKAEEAWQQGRYTLEKRVAERTADLTRAREAAEERAAESEEGRSILQALMEYIPEGIVIATGPKVTIRWVSRYAQEFLGRSPEALQGLSVREKGVDWFVGREGGDKADPEDLPLVRATLGGEVVTDEEWIVRRDDGAHFTLSVNAGPIRDREGHFTGGIAAWRDVTERKSGERERERLLAEFDSTFLAIADGVMIFGPQGEILRINPAAREILNYSDDIIAAPLSERRRKVKVEGPEGKALPMEKWPSSRALRGETVRGQILVLRLPGDRRVWLSASAAPIRLPGGGLLGAVATLTDITQIHELQEQHELYLHTISHDLRAPLTVIYGHLQLLCKDLGAAAGEETRRNLDAVLKSAERMNLMIEDLVDAARLEGGELILEKEEVRISDFLDDFLKRSEPALEVGRIRLEIPHGIAPVRADTDRLERILHNLISNALKYSPPTTPVLVAAEQTAEEIVISVIDQGEGITSRDQEHIFKRFYRPKGARRVDSVGLGLYITRMLVEAHGGRLWVKSRKGEGSTFCFTLPRVEDSGVTSL